jgi:hypothetical protein
MSTDAHGTATAAGSGEEHAASAEPAGIVTSKQWVRGEADSTGDAAKKKTRSVCPHKCQRNQCKECGGAGICQHQHQRNACKECGWGGHLPTP